MLMLSFISPRCIVSLLVYIFIFSLALSITPPEAKMDRESERETPWRDGNYKKAECNSDGYVIAGQKLTVNGTSFVSKLTYGLFGQADPKVVEITGEKYYNVKSSYDILGKKMTDYGVLVENGTKFIFEGRTLVWITEEEEELMAKDCDAIEAPASHYKVEPKRQGRLIWITGAPGLGKSTSAQLLSREHGYVYYEGDCFLALRNPFVPPDVENPSLAQSKQKKLVGKGKAEREKIAWRVFEQYKAAMKGQAWDAAIVEEGCREMLRDIARERSRLGGDWAIAGILFTSSMRQIARFSEIS